jgi:hypothetical protein
MSRAGGGWLALLFWVLAAVGVLAAAGACTGNTTNNTDAGAPDSGHTTGSSTSGTCTPPTPTPCTTQADCDDRNNIVLTHACVPTGSSNATMCVLEPPLIASSTGCQDQEAVVQFRANLGPQIQPQTVHSIFVRGYYATKTDGNAVSCSDLLAETAFPDGGSAQDADGTLNLSFWDGFPYNGGNSTVAISTTLAVSSGQAFYLEAYTGGVATDTHLPLGVLLARGCVDQTDITPSSGSTQQVQIDLNGP